ncbi:class F sortase [Nocardioides sp. YIM 152588]|uniref:class F sortase n=1 Tax=Nocardioides sp. YIM 152588 TaxID=3158259 RepID=UPI0032E522EB
MRRLRRGALATLAAVVALAVVVGAALVVVRVSTGSWTGSGDAGVARDPDTSVPAPSGSTAASPTASDALRPMSLLDRCRADAALRSGFVPETVRIPGVTDGAVVDPAPRDALGVIGVPPLTAGAQLDFAWDAEGARPGSRRGNVTLTAHTLPQGTGMGNHLLASYGVGDLVVLEGPDDRISCYRTSDEIEVTPEDPDALVRVYAADGPPQVVVIVCSGVRLGPGDWTHRTVWFADLVRGRG